MGWKKTAAGRQVWVADLTYSPEELEAANTRVRAQVADGGRGIGIGIWKPESTVQATGEEMSKAEFEAFKKDLGAEEVNRGNTAERVRRQTAGDLAKQAIAEAKEMLLETQQYVAPGTPTTERTRVLQAKGKPIIAMPEEPAEAAPAQPEKGAEQPQVDARTGRRQPWGYAGGKEDIIAMAAQAARVRADERVADKGL